MRLAQTIRAAALLEAAKGALVLVVGFGVLSFVHRDVQRFAEALVGHLHLNPAGRYPRIFLDFAARLADARLWWLAAAAAVYAALRFIEAWGLWRERRWAEWFAALSGGVYLPFELYEFLVRPNWLSVGALAVNAAIVALMLVALRWGQADGAPRGP